MLDKLGANDIKSSGEVGMPDTAQSHSSVEFLQKLENNEIKLKLTTTTDVLSDLLSNVISVLLNIEICKNEKKDPIFILRDALFDESPEVGQNQLVAMWRINQENAIRGCLQAYQFAINNKMDANKAASVLPIGNTMIEAEVVVDRGSIMESTTSGLTSECTEILLLCQDEISNNTEKLIKG